MKNKKSCHPNVLYL